MSFYTSFHKEMPINLTAGTILKIMSILEKYGVTDTAEMLLSNLALADDQELLDRGEERGTFRDYFYPRLEKSPIDEAVVICRAMVLKETGGDQAVEQWLKQVLRMGQQQEVGWPTPILSLGDIVGFLSCFSLEITTDKKLLQDGLVHLVANGRNVPNSFRKEGGEEGAVFIQMLTHGPRGDSETSIGKIFKVLSMGSELSGGEKFLFPGDVLSTLRLEATRHGHIKLCDVSKIIVSKLFYAQTSMMDPADLLTRLQ